jgi:SAM-dependent methyltransferase
MHLPDPIPVQLPPRDPRLPRLSFLNGSTASMRIPITVVAAIAFDVAIEIGIYTVDQGRLVYTGSSAIDTVRVRWLPRGEYSVDWIMPRMALSPGYYRMHIVATALHHRVLAPLAEQQLDIEVQGNVAGAGMGQAHWHFASEGAVPFSELAWQQGHDSWFFRHFDHAAETIVDYMLGNSPLLAGKILDVGCGDGITDLGVYLRTRPELLVGIDPDRAYERLPQILHDNHLDIELPKNFIHTADDANHIPYADNFFDVVISWGSIEHIAGGYLQTLAEIKRVLRPDGLLFIHPGLYFGNFGHHLGEFSSEPFFHLTKTSAQIQELVFSKDPRLMDRSGYEHVSQQDFWRYFTELNPITVAGLERELRQLDFEFYRAALRTEERIEYTHPNLQQYPVQDLATVEFYLSAYNRKGS